MSRVRHIVFDIGNVLIRYDREIPYRRLIPEPQRRQWFLENVCTTAWNAEQDSGRTWAKAEKALIAKYPTEAEYIRAFRRYWHEMVPGPISDSVAVFQSLVDRGCDVTMLTNFAADTFREVCERFSFLRIPRGVTVSANVGLIKPDAAIFKYHAETFALEPEATLLIDDDLSNIDGAICAGWQAILFSDAGALIEELERLGV